MKAKELIKNIKDDLMQTKESGQELISIDALNNYLSQFDTDIENDTYYKSLDHERELAKFKAANDRDIANANIQTTIEIEMFKSVIASGQSALKSSMVINGGGAAALLAFAGKIWGTSISVDVANALTNSIFIFSLGVLCAALATGTTYMSQLSFSSKYFKTGHVINCITVSIIVLSYLLFCYGSYEAAKSLGFHFVL